VYSTLAIALLHGLVADEVGHVLLLQQNLITVYSWNTYPRNPLCYEHMPELVYVGFCCVFDQLSWSCAYYHVRFQSYTLLLLPEHMMTSSLLWRPEEEERVMAKI